jgi:hypothetical protein
MQAQVLAKKAMIDVVGEEHGKAIILEMYALLGGH